MTRKSFLYAMDLKRRMPVFEDDSFKIDQFLDTYEELIGILSEYGKEKLIFEFAGLLEEQELQHSAEKAFQIAQHSESNDSTELLFRYFDEVSNELKKSNLSVRQQRLYLEILVYLGENRKLLSEYTRLYREIYGVLSHNIEKFIQLGMKSRHLRSRK